MQDWRQRGYVVDSDDEDLAGPVINTGSQDLATVSNPDHGSQLLSSDGGLVIGAAGDSGIQSRACPSEGEKENIRPRSSDSSKDPTLHWGRRSTQKRITTYGTSGKRQTTTVRLPPAQPGPVTDLPVTDEDTFITNEPSPFLDASVQSKGLSDLIGHITSSSPRHGPNGASTVHSISEPASETLVAGQFALQDASPPSSSLPSPGALTRLPPRPAPQMQSAQGSDSSDLSDLSDSTGHRLERRVRLHGSLEPPRRAWLPSRSFRLRKAIQLHPYAIEGEQYRQTMRSRGYRPVHVAGSTLAESMVGPAQETQQESQLSDASELASDIDVLVPDDVPASLSPIVYAQRQSPDHDVETLPDLDALLQARVNGPTGRLPKRKRLQLPAGVTRAQPLADTTSAHHSPPTPPTTKSRSDRARPTSLRLPIGLDSPISAPVTTPRSTDQRTATRKPALHSLTARDTPMVTTISSSQPSDSDSSSSDNEADFRRMGRMLRGVLPPSWLKVNEKSLRHETAARTKKVIRPSGAQDQGRKGVARRVTSGQTPNRADADDFLDTDVSDQAAEPTTGVRPSAQQTGSPIRNLTTQTRHDDDVGPKAPVYDLTYSSDEMEHDTVDAMLAGPKPPRTRPTGKSRTHQPRITSAFRPTDMHTTPAEGHEHSTSTRRHKRKSRRKVPIKLGILDALPERNPEAGRQPDFLRLAARRARQRQDKGRHSPTHKAIRLATRHDTTDATSTLTDWQAGTLQRRQGVTKDKGRPPAPTVTTQKARGGPAEHIRGRHGPSRQFWQRPGHAFRTAQIETEGSVRLGELLRSHVLEQSQSARAPPRPSLLMLPAVTTRVPDLASSPEGGPSRINNGLRDVQVSHPVHKATPRRRVRKRPAKRIEVEAREFRQPSEPLPSEPVAVAIQPEVEEIDRPTSPSLPGLKGVTSSSTRFSTDFDVRPLDIGTFFRESSFVGSGDFSHIWSIRTRDLDIPAGQISVQLGDRTVHWGAWNEEVVESLGEIHRITEEAFQVIVHETEPGDAAGARSTVVYLLRSLVRFTSRCLWFMDSVDKESCLSHFLRFAETYQELVRESYLTTADTASARWNFLHLECLLYTSCTTFSMLLIAETTNHEGLAASLKQRCEALLQTATLMALPGGRTALRTHLEASHRLVEREAGISDDSILVNWVVITHHLGLDEHLTTSSLDAVLHARFADTVKQSDNAQLLDQVWYDVFVLQPYLSIDRRGIVRPGRRDTSLNDCSGLVLALLERTFELYSQSSAAAQPFQRGYIRAIITRVQHFVSRWHWQRCEHLLSCAYDFFAKRELAHLPGEIMHVSPVFLNSLDSQPMLIVRETDCAFHAFLKLVAVGLHTIADYAPTKQVRRIGWRLVPNHGRTYRKDENVRQADLDSLRNHHDLLVTLFWSLPSGCRPRLEHIKNLVDFQVSHQEACYINITAWKQVAKLIMAHEDRYPEIPSLAQWFDEITSGIREQHSLARSEAEELALNRTTDTPIMINAVQMTVSANQKRLLETLMYAMTAMQDALKVCATLRAAWDLVLLARVTRSLDVFDASQRRTFASVMHSLKAIRQCLDMASPAIAQSEESQDYGDWSALEDLGHVSAPAGDDVEQLMSPVAQLLSNCFGADAEVDESLLACLVEVWCMLAKRLVDDGTKTWDQYLDEHSTESWFQLRQTEKTRKWTPFALSKILSIDAASFKSAQSRFQACWIVSLLERDSLLKFQHLFTSRILDLGGNNGLTRNPPFARDTLASRFEISLTELRNGRVALLGTVMANMRTSVEVDNDAVDLRVEYAHMLRQAMSCMQRSYQELSASSTPHADSNVRGAHVGFVQQVVGLMQQYTSDICAVDLFFTDSAAFPLPGGDPAYVVGRLKAYVPRLGNLRGKKQLVVFVCTLVSKAHTQHEEYALVKQLHQASMGGDGALALRKVLLGCIVPAFLEVAIEKAEVKPFARTMLEACGVLLEDVRFQVETSSSEHELKPVLRTLAGMSMFVRSVIAGITGSDGLGPDVFMAARHAVVLADYMDRVNGSGGDMLRLISELRHLGDIIANNTSGPDLEPSMVIEQGYEMQATLDFSKREITELTRRRHGDGPVHAAAENGQTATSGRNRLLAAVDDFNRAYDMVLSGAGGFASALHGEGLLV